MIIAGQADPTILTFTEDTFVFTIGDGTTVLQPLVSPPDDGTEQIDVTMLTVSGSLTVEGDTSFKLTVSEENGVDVTFAEEIDDFTRSLTVGGSQRCSTGSPSSR